MRVADMHISEPHPGVFVIDDVLRASDCRGLLWLIDSKRPANAEPPNSMNRYGLALEDVKMKWLATDLWRGRVLPVARKHYPDVGPLEKPYGFLVEYSNKQRSLSSHIDEPSAVTLNLCLGRDFEGGRLVFHGLRCRRHADVRYRAGERFEIEHKIGRAIIHRGWHTHSALPIDSGRRANLILWCGAKKRSRKHPVWCGASKE